MKFLILISASMKVLIMKYQNKVGSQSIGSNVISKIRDVKLLLPADTKALVQLLTTIRDYLVKNDVKYQRAQLMKLVGDGSTWRGLLNVIAERGDDMLAYCYDPGTLARLREELERASITDLSDVRAIAPLNIDETDEIYAFFQQELEIPVYPMICNIATSKWLKNFLFAPHAPRAFYFPEDTVAMEFYDKVVELAKKHGIKHFILKDEYDFDIRPVLPYLVVPAEKMDVACRLFYENVQGVHDYGGILLEEFIPTGDAIDVVTTHMFKGMLPAPLVVDKIKLKLFDDGGLFDTIVQYLQTTVLQKAPVGTEALNAIVAKYYPYMLASIEYIVHKGVPKVNDINSVSNVMTWDKPIPGLNPDAFFKEFVSKVTAFKNDEELPRQVQYHEMIKGLYD
ncbi:MAG: hypothetical protein JW839_04200, partial [Candidatus Lokiarchaeota archaeon]|nr:hypothetical protein [Candidatus Lokiarchaeota archaeon]